VRALLESIPRPQTERTVAGARWTRSVGGAAPEGSLRRVGTENPGRDHQLGDRAKNQGEDTPRKSVEHHDAIVRSWLWQEPNRLSGHRMI